MELDRIQVVLHPESVIHSMVEYDDSAVIGQLGTPDMRLPIQYALFYPDRKPILGANGWICFSWGPCILKRRI